MVSTLEIGASGIPGLRLYDLRFRVSYKDYIGINLGYIGMYKDNGQENGHYYFKV